MCACMANTLTYSLLTIQYKDHHDVPVGLIYVTEGAGIAGGEIQRTGSGIKQWRGWFLLINVDNRRHRFSSIKRHHEAGDLVALVSVTDLGGCLCGEDV